MKVRLWVDEPETLAMLAPSTCGVEIRQWRIAASACSLTLPADVRMCQPADVADVVIEAFGCKLPPARVVAMSARTPQPIWINLEYLGLEDWVEGCHALPSPAPTGGLCKYFFFPGFTTGTGGLLCERAWSTRARRFKHDEGGEYSARRLNMTRMLCGDAATPPATPLLSSLFCYRRAPVSALLDAWIASPFPHVSLVAAGLPSEAVRACLGEPRYGGDGLPAHWQAGQTRLFPIHFLPQEMYDELLWVCDLNFVRGEDSFVQAQWAGRPLVWQAYPQAEDAHHVKVDAFLRRYAAHAALADFWRFWNGMPMGVSPAILWQNLCEALPAAQQHACLWRDTLAGQEDLLARLIRFCNARMGAGPARARFKAEMPGFVSVPGKPMK
jgi:uncharacterized repeat protein (TIGR03837 family)